VTQHLLLQNGCASLNAEHNAEAATQHTTEQQHPTRKQQQSSRTSPVQPARRESIQVLSQQLGLWLLRQTPHSAPHHETTIWPLTGAHTASNPNCGGGAPPRGGDCNTAASCIASQTIVTTAPQTTAQHTFRPTFSTDTTTASFSRQDPAQHNTKQACPAMCMSAKNHHGSYSFKHHVKNQIKPAHELDVAQQASTSVVVHASHHTATPAACSRVEQSSCCMTR
jgi:hypothetical protein